MPSVLITGANRGIGLGLAQSYAGEGWRVFATCRFPDEADDLKALAGDVHIHRLDVTVHEQIAALASKLESEPIDLLINNAGIWIETSHGLTPDWRIWEENFAVHAIGPLKLAEAFAPHVERSAKKQMVFVSSGLGSIQRNAEAVPMPTMGVGGAYAFRASKAAMNMACVSLAHAMKPRGVTVLVVSPGNVRTRQSGPKAQLSIEESIAALRKIFDGLTLAQTGTFLRHTGEVYAW